MSDLTRLPHDLAVDVRLIGVIEAEQAEEGETLHNDRILAVAKESLSYAATKTTGDLAPGLVETITSFWTNTKPCAASASRSSASKARPRPSGVSSKPCGRRQDVMAKDEDAATIDGSAPGGVGLLIIDMINPMDFTGAEAVRPKAERAADVILDLRETADRLKVPVIYVNDNYGEWHSDKSRIVEACLAEESPGRAMVRKIAPRDDDYFVIKPQVSGFYATNLPVLLPKLGVSRLVLTGIAADICVLFTAADAHMRAYDLWVPRDAVASEADERTCWALEIMRKSMQAETASTSDLQLAAWLNS